MGKYLGYCFLFINLACTTDIEVHTAANYEVVLLPDGSQVYLNHHSSISYQEHFDPRTLNLSGEAFFIVEPNTSIFTVTTAHGDIKVLGTEFNVKTNSDQVAVEVKKGVVELQTQYDKSTLKKGIKAVYKDGEQAIRKIKSDNAYRKWIRSLKKDFKALGKELQPTLKEIGKDVKKAREKIGTALKN